MILIPSRYRKVELMVGLSVLCVLLAILGSFLILSRSIFAAEDRPRNLEYFCDRGVGTVAKGTLVDGRRYKVVEFSLIGNDYANGYYGENGWFLSPSLYGRCPASNAVVRATWGGSGQDKDMTVTPNSVITRWNFYQPDDAQPIDLWLGSPLGYNSNSNTSTGPLIGIGSPIYRAQYGISNSMNSTNFATINDGGGAWINGQKIWCIGMPSSFFGTSCAGPDAHTIQPGGCDCWGFLNKDNPRVTSTGVLNPDLVPYTSTNRSLIGKIPGISRDANGYLNEFELSMMGMNTRDDGSYGTSGTGLMPNYKATTRLTFIYPPADREPGGTVEGDCNILTGIASDPDWNGDIQVHIYRDGVSVGSATTTAGRWSYDISRFGDFNGHTYEVFVIGVDRNGNASGVNPSIRRLNIGPCASATCQQYSISGLLEVGSEFILNASVQTNVSSGGASSGYSASLSIPSATYITPISTSGTVTNGSNTPVASWKVRIDSPGDHDGEFVFHIDGASITCPFTNNYNGGGECGPGGCPIEVSVKPYFKVYGGNVTSGVSDITCALGSTISSSSGRILAYSSGAGNGSGTQLIAQAIGNIDGFSSAQGPAGNSSPDKGLSLSNIDGNPTYGGAFGYGACPDLPIPNTGATGSFDGSSPTVLNTGEKRVIYVNGDTTIRGNVTYSGTWTKPEDVPSFVLVVTGGNIYIDKSVTELHGLYVAKPASDGTKGNIYTCTKGSVLYSESELSTGVDQNSLPCSTPLAVYGSFMAKQVKLLRTNGRVSAASNIHTWDTLLAPQLSPAEKFIYSPEVWFRSNGAGSTVDGGATFDSLKPMPPVL